MRFKALADKKHDIFDEDLVALMTGDNASDGEVMFKLSDLEVSSKMGAVPEARVELDVQGEQVEMLAQGDGPVDAALKAIEKIAQSGAEIKLYNVNAINAGTESQGEVTVRLERAGRIVNGVGADTDIVVASARAYLHALNQMMRPQVRQHPQTSTV